ncbi:MAG: LysM peptidoglycan-binding domain-containing protein [Achromobacter sp.]|uniref:LysM peptidoglycan-binding domain-containing protein n=1 Tax=Achromobacter sp. TaxID=134375 RepID=UPI003D02289B
MAVTTPKKTGFEKWQDTINLAASDPGWNAWDCEIQTAVSEYNRHLSGTANYRQLDWHLIKAIAWVETGAESRKWGTNMMQIGNPGDPGLRALLTGNEGGELIIPAPWKSRLTLGSAVTVPSHNIRAGVGYLLMRLANYSNQTVLDPDAAIYEVAVQSGDSMSRIAAAKGSTVEIMQRLNPSARVLRIGQVLKYQKGSVRKVITGWKPITTSNIATYYNVGDKDYAKKLDYALVVMRTGKGVVCAR